mmetsp:Transcript_32115/g.99466  ORF Transcript_32115/g.99466 Transcript_32115/m.99466 type:complete len:300 (+) Transcript_32115:914-1813(+)
MGGLTLRTACSSACSIARWCANKSTLVSGAPPAAASAGSSYWNVSTRFLTYSVTAGILAVAVSEYISRLTPPPALPASNLCPLRFSARLYLVRSSSVMLSVNSSRFFAGSCDSTSALRRRTMSARRITVSSSSRLKPFSLGTQRGFCFPTEPRKRLQYRSANSLRRGSVIGAALVQVSARSCVYSSSGRASVGVPVRSTTWATCWQSASTALVRPAVSFLIWCDSSTMMVFAVAAMSRRASRHAYDTMTTEAATETSAAFLLRTMQTRSGAIFHHLSTSRRQLDTSELGQAMMRTPCSR